MAKAASGGSQARAVWLLGPSAPASLAVTAGRVGSSNRITVVNESDTREGGQQMKSRETKQRQSFGARLL